MAEVQTRAFKGSMLVAPLGFQFFMLFAGVICISGEEMIRIVLGGLVMYGLGVALVVKRRLNHLTKWDVLFIQYGFFLFWFLHVFFIGFWRSMARHMGWY